jgi:hypothetical protein
VVGRAHHNRHDTGPVTTIPRRHRASRSVVSAFQIGNWIQDCWIWRQVPACPYLTSYWRHQLTHDYESLSHCMLYKGSGRWSQETRFTVETKNIALSCTCAFWGKLRVKRHIDALSRSGTGNKKYRNNPSDATKKVAILDMLLSVTQVGLICH